MARKFPASAGNGPAAGVAALMLMAAPSTPAQAARKPAKPPYEGCVAVTNEEIEEIWRLVKDGTTVEIHP